MIDFKIGCQSDSKKKYFIIYSFLFVFIMAVILRPFWLGGKSLVWKNDGLYQHYSSLAYYSNWLKTVFFEHKFPMVDLAVGFGYDVISTLNYYAIGDPLNLITIFFREEQLEYVYNFLIILRYYLAGVSFSIYCFYMKQSFYPTLAGTLTYIFCGFCLFAGVRHPFFLNPVIYFPLLLIGVERIIENKKPWLFSALWAISVMGNYYFAYMLAITSLIYGFIRTLSVKSSFKDYIVIFFRAVGYFLLGTGIAAVLFVPAVLGFSGNSRLGAILPQSSMLLYPYGYYIRLLFDFISPLTGEVGYWSLLNYNALAAIAVIFLLASKNRELLWLKQLFIVYFLMLCIPWIGRMMNGFSYVINRWIWAFCFVVAFNFVCHCNTIVDTKSRFLLCSSLILSLLFFSYCICVKTLRFEILIGFMLLFLCLLLMIVFQTCIIAKHYQKTAFLLLIICSIIVSADYKFNINRKNYVSEFRNSGQVLNSIKRTPESSILKTGDSSDFRVSSAETLGILNQGLVMGTNSLTTYFSIVPNDIYQYLLSTEIPGITMPFRYYGLDQRNALEALASVKYYAQQEDAKSPYPAGYEKIETYLNPYSGKNDVVYINNFYLPLGYTYSSFVNEKEYEALNPVYKEQLMLQAVVLENVQKNSETYEFLGQTVSYEITESKNIHWDDGAIEISRANSKLEFQYVVPKDNTVYIRLKGLDINGNPDSDIDIPCTSNGYTKNICPKTRESTWYIDRENYTINFGLSDGTSQTCSITFPKKATYQLEDIEVYSVPAYRYAEYIDKLKEECLEDIVVGTNRITGRINVTDKKYLCLSIPYGKGWHAYVDGAETELLKANIMYMALPLETGQHEIRLEYCTPGLKAGATVSVISIIVFLFICLKNRKSFGP